MSDTHTHRLPNGGDGSWAFSRPSPTVVGTFAPDVIAAPGYRKAGDGPRQKQPGSIRVTVQEAGVLQSFPADYPWQGKQGAQFLQVGNSVPPLLQKALTAPLLATLPGEEADTDLLMCPTNLRPHAALRSPHEPAPTMAFGHETPRWVTRRQVEEFRARRDGNDPPTESPK